MNNYTTLAVAAMMVMMAVPAAIADPGSYDDRKTILGPGSFHIQGIGTTGPGICFRGAPFPPACAPVPWSAGGIGSANFDISHLAGATEGIRFWVQWAGGFFSVVQGGFVIMPCTDRDDDGGCFSTDPANDDSGIAAHPYFISGHPVGQYDDIFGFFGYSNDALIQGIPCDKATKDCGNPFTAESSFCIQPDTLFQDIPANGVNPHTLERRADGAYDDVTVFVGVWAGSLSEPGKVGAGISAGIYDVYVEYTGSGCILA